MTTLPWTPLAPAKFNAIPQALRDLIVEAKRLQLALDLRDGPFVGTIVSSPAWNQMFNGNYPVPSTGSMLVRLEGKLRSLVARGERLLLERETDAPMAPLMLLERPEMRRVEEALKEAGKRLQRGLEERLITVVGPTRSGKSCLLRMLREKGKIDWAFRALPSTKARYRKFLEGLAKAVGLRDIGKMDVTDLEEALLAKFNGVPCVLAIEELQRMSRRALEFLKCVLNETQASIILCLKPGEWKAMKRNLNEDMQQFLGRNITTITLHITAEMVAGLAKAEWPAGGDPSLFRQIAVEAEKGGGMSAVRILLENSARLSGAKPVSAAAVVSALKLYRTGVPELTATAAKVWGKSKKAAA